MAAFEGRGWATELIVCDNNSTDATADIARAAGATVVFEPVNQIARARNSRRRGRPPATGCCSWTPTPCPRARSSRTSRTTIAGGRVLAGGATVTMDDRRFWARAMVGSGTGRAALRAGRPGRSSSSTPTAFRQAGGFNQALYAGEEIDLFRRLKTAARRRRPGIRILHRHPLSHERAQAAPLLGA